MVLVLTVMFVDWKTGDNLSNAEQKRLRQMSMTRVAMTIIRWRILGATSGKYENNISESAINKWLARKLPSSHPAFARLQHSPPLDPWHQPFRYIATDHFLEPIKVFSTGPDKITKTSGHDLDDLRAWDIEGAKWYYNEVKRKNTARSWFVGGIAAPVLYLALIAVFRIFKRKNRDSNEEILD